MCATVPEPVLDFETKAPRTDDDGNALFSVRLVVLQKGGADVIAVKTASKPDVAQGEMVKPAGLTANPWSMGNRSGVAYKANRVEADRLAPKATK